MLVVRFARQILLVTAVVGGIACCTVAIRAADLDETAIEAVAESDATGETSSPLPGPYLGEASPESGESAPSRVERASLQEPKATEDEPAPPTIEPIEPRVVPDGRRAAERDEPTYGSLAKPSVLTYDDEVYEDYGFAELLSTGTWLRAGHLFAQADLVMLHRNTAPRQVLSIDAVTVSGQTFFTALLMTTETGGFGYEPGTKVTLGKFYGRDIDNRDRTLELTYFGGFDWSSDYTVTASAGQFLVTPLANDAPGIQSADAHTYTYESDLNSLEINAKLSSRLPRDRMVMGPDGSWVRECTPSWLPSYMAGVRWINAEEQFSFGAIGPQQFALYDITTQNDLLGVQLGLELTEQHCRWNWGATGKLGGYVNFAEQHTLYDSQVGAQTFTRDELKTDEELTLGLELNLRASYQIRPNLALRVGYNFMYLQGLALGPQQLEFNTANTPILRTGNHYFLDGGNIGIEWVW
jgi:hypothetical protein